MTLQSIKITSVRDYLLKQTELNLTRYEEATVNSNYIYLVKLLPPSKNEALAYLDRDGPKPERKAIAIVLPDATFPPIVREYTISPVTNPNDHKIRIIPGKVRDFVPFNARPFDGSIEGNVLNEAIINDASQALLNLMRESYDGYTYTNCTDKCFSFSFTAPMGFTSEDRYTWIFFIRKVTGEYSHPLDLQLLVDHSGADVRKWKVLKVIYNNQTFDSVDELVNEYNKGTIHKIKIPSPIGKDSLFSSYERRGDPQPVKPMRGPEMYEPDGKRYTVSGPHVNYMSWSFDFRKDSNSGMQIYDINFNGATNSASKKPRPRTAATIQTLPGTTSLTVTLI